MTGSGAGASTPSQVYAQGALEEKWQDDPAQHAALAELDRIHLGLLEGQHEGWLDRLSSLWASPVPVRGLYYWGSVGRGKTFLVDLFYDNLPLHIASGAGRADGLLADGGTAGSGSRSGRGAGGGKYRTHFHRFMRGVHQRLREHAGHSDPLARIAQEWGDELRVLVLDEFFVTDIGDAMLLGRLLEQLFAHGVTLITTSNTAPPDLYANGLQRESFLPAIALLQQHCMVLETEGSEDYRLRALTRSPVYRQPLDERSDAWLAERWRELSGVEHKRGNIDIEGRRIAVRARGKGISWFDFAALCEGPRSSNDYIEIAREFHTVLLGGIPAFDRDNEDAARRFVTLVDELYDRQVNLVCSAAAPPTALYSGIRLEGAFERAASRLIEMQSADYLAAQHKA